MDFLFDFGAGFGVFGGGVDFERLHEIVVRFTHWRWQANRERSGRHIEHHHLSNGGEVWCLGKIFSGKGGAEGLDHELRIGDTNTTTNDGTDVTEESFADFLGKLRHKLVGDDEIEAVFPSLREDGLEGVGGEVLELVHVETEILAFILWDVLP